MMQQRSCVLQLRLDTAKLKQKKELEAERCKGCIIARQWCTGAVLYHFESMFSKLCV